MKTKTAEVELTKENEALTLKLIDRANKLADEIKLLQSVIKAGGHSARHAQLLHDELDVVRDYREVTLERIAVLTLGDLSPKTPNDPEYQPAGLGALGELDSEEEDKALKGWDVMRGAMFNASVKS